MVNESHDALVRSRQMPMGRPAHSLTAREREVLILIARGKTSREIAEELRIAYKTVTCHRYRVMEKLSVRNSVELTLYAIRAGLVDP
jgi:DNA-binding NarL/FixJ family response regulator